MGPRRCPTEDETQGCLGSPIPRRLGQRSQKWGTRFWIQADLFKLQGLLISVSPTTTATQTDQARPSSNSNSFGVTKRPPIKRPTKKATRKTTVSSSSTNSANSDNSSLRGITNSTTSTTVSSTDRENVSDSIKRTTKILPKKTTPKRFKPKKKTRRTTVSPAAPADEENNSDSSTNTKTPAKKYFQNLKNRLP